MRVRIQGTNDLKRLRDALIQMVADMDAMGITQVARGAFYFTPVDETGDEVRPRRYGKAVTSWSVRNTPPPPTRLIRSRTADRP
jgi:hypothetical protein